MTILIDPRLGSGDLPDYECLSKVSMLTKLESADAAFAGNGPDGKITIGVELKSIGDLVSSSVSGRLQGILTGQVPRMMRDYDICWLLYYGQHRSGKSGLLEALYLCAECRKSGYKDSSCEVMACGEWRTVTIGVREIPYSYIAALLLTLTAFGIREKRVETKHEAAIWLSILYRWWSKNWKDHEGMHCLDCSGDLSLAPTFTRAEVTRAIVAKAIDGIGYKLAVEAVMPRFRSVRQMVNADRDEWLSIPGIGKTIADSVERSLS